MSQVELLILLYKKISLFWSFCVRIMYMKKQIIILIILVGVLYGYYLISEPTVSEVQPVFEDQNISETIDRERIPTQYACVGEFCDGSGFVDRENYTVVTIPLVQDGGPIGCGSDIFFAPHAIPKTITPLDASYRLLFDIKPLPEIQSDGFHNVVGNYTWLNYESVILDNAVARVYLTGTMYGPGHCSLPELRAQISQTALQFDTVDVVEVYLNGRLYDWCEQDLSDGEGGCPENPRYWIDQ